MTNKQIHRRNNGLCNIIHQLLKCTSRKYLHLILETEDDAKFLHSQGLCTNPIDVHGVGWCVTIPLNTLKERLSSLIEYPFITTADTNNELYINAQQYEKWFWETQANFEPWEE